MPANRLVEYVFFFGLLAIAAFLVWKLFAPFIAPIALAAIVVTLCSPMYRRVKYYMPRQNASLAALVSTFLVIFIVIAPAVLIGFLVFREAGSIYTLFSSNAHATLTGSINTVQNFIAAEIPGFTIDIPAYAKSAADFVTSHLASIFASTATTIFLFFLTLVATFYFFRDGKQFTKVLVEISPLPDDQDEIILARLARSVRSVVLGTVLVALIQGVLTAIGLSIFGFEHAILWGAVASFSALVPGLGTSTVFIPSIIYLFLNGAYVKVIGVAVWATLAVGLIDNLLGPYLISRGGTLHPFFILLSVLGGITFFGPVGFLIGPVVLSLFKVLLELYMTHISSNAVTPEHTP